MKNLFFILSLIFSYGLFAQKPMAKEFIQEKIDSIQVEQDELFSHYRVYRILEAHFGKNFKSNHYVETKIKDSTIIYYTQTTTNPYSKYYISQKNDSLVLIEKQALTNKKIAYLFSTKSRITKYLDSTKSLNDTLIYDILIYPFENSFKTYALAIQMKDSSITLGVDYYFLFNQNIELIKQDRFHSKSWTKKLYEKINNERKLSAVGGIIPIYDKGEPFIYASDIVKFRWYKTKELVYFKAYCPRNKRGFLYDYKTNKITFGL